MNQHPIVLAILRDDFAGLDTAMPMSVSMVVAVPVSIIVTISSMSVCVR
jgi:hypothetical protein